MKKTSPVCTIDVPTLPLNRKLIERLNARAFGGLPSEDYDKAYQTVADDAICLGRARPYDAAGPLLISKAAAVYDDLHVYAKKTRAELKALVAIARDSNDTMHAKLVAALSYKSLAGERP